MKNLQSLSPSKHIYIVPCVASEWEAHLVQVISKFPFMHLNYPEVYDTGNMLCSDRFIHTFWHLGISGLEAENNVFYPSVTVFHFYFWHCDTFPLWQCAYDCSVCCQCLSLCSCMKSWHADKHEKLIANLLSLTNTAHLICLNCLIS